VKKSEASCAQAKERNVCKIVVSKFQGKETIFLGLVIYGRIKLKKLLRSSHDFI
jgi:hypothetical protein